MGKINLLTEEVANLIAAGEVVDRPASVLKELLENAIDAGATSVTAEIERGGVGLLRVSDNGSGIAPEDLPVALQRHATSKIRCAADLDEILTLGFRGEALAAIAGVSVLEIVTRTQTSEVGTLLTAEYGRITEVCEVGCRPGTTVTVRELFGNVPARRKFLKKDVTEASAAVAYAEKIALSHPEVALTLSVDGVTRFSTAGDGDVMGVLYAIEGREFAKKLLGVKGELSGMSLSGYVGRSDNVAGTRNRQNFFINGRYIRSKTMQAALEQAFTSYIAPGKFPACALFLTIAPGAVDVNVHPAKLEVRFSDERPVFEIVYHAVRGALSAAAYRPELLREKPMGTDTPAVRPSFAPPPTAPRQASGIPIPPAGSSTRELPPQESLRILAELKPSDAVPLHSDTPLAYPDRPSDQQQEREKTPPCEPPRQGMAPLPPFTLIGEAFSTYLLVELEDTLLVIDKHAAHERILFEELLAEQQASGRAASQGLLLPLTLRPTGEELAAAAEYRDDLLAAGFSYEIMGVTVTVDAIPARITPEAAEALFLSLLASLAEGAGVPHLREATRRERALWQVACKAAIKGGRTYGEEHLLWLCRRVLSRPDITVCPHGRPIAFTMTKKQLDREFCRIQH